MKKKNFLFGLLICLFFIFSSFSSSNITIQTKIYLEENLEETETFKIKYDFENLTVGDIKSLTSLYNSEEVIESITYESSNEDIAQIDNTGKITALSAGTVTIKANYLDLEDSITIEVLEKEDNTVIEKEDNSIIENKKQNLSAPLTLTAPKEQQNLPLSISYAAHIEDIGWQEYKYDGDASGTTGQSKRVEGIKINLNNQVYDGNIEYSSYVETVGWQDYVSNGELSGTTGESKKLEAIKIRLTGDMEKYYDIYYRVHCERFGWLGWAKNDSIAGTLSYDYRLEAIEIKLVNKGDQIETNAPSYYQRYINYATHIEDIGWQEYKYDGDISGTTGQSKRVEGIKINLESQLYSGNIEYSSYVEAVGWQDYVSNGELSGTTGESKKLEAIKIRLTGDMEKHYDIYYRVHCERFGWFGWAKNGENAGTIGYDYRLEAIEIKLLNKGDQIETNAPSYYQRYINYAAHIEDIGWQEYKYDGDISGTTGQSKRVEGIKINLENQLYSGNIEYSSYVEAVGWQDYVSNGELSGTTGESKKLEAIKIRLTGDMEKHYDIYYRVHCERFGWFGWAKNGGIAGTIGYDYRLEAIEIKLLNKGNQIETNAPSYYQRYINYATHIEDIGWQEYKYDGDAAGTTGQAKRIEAIMINLDNQIYLGNIEYSSYVEAVGWQDYVSNGELSGTTGESKKLEAIKIRLTGDMEKNYDIIYRAHCEKFGWLGWARNNEIAGTTGYDYRLEAIEIKLVNKGTSIINEKEAYYSYGDSYFVISSKLNDNKVVDVYGASLINGSNVSIHDINYTVAQIWQINALNNDYYSISSSMNPNIFLTVDENNVVINTYTGSNSQLWKIVNNDDGYYTIISKLNGKYLTLDGRLDNKTNIFVTDFNNTDYQKFKIVKYEGKLVYNGLDVSDHQGQIDWHALQSSINFAILRVGFGSDYESQDDLELINNIKGCEENNIPYGLYIYSYALNTSDAQSEVNHVLRLLSNTGSNFKLGIWFDMEDADGYKARNGMPSNETLVDICHTFVSEIQSNGYKAGIYASKSWFENQLNSPKIASYDKWVAHWPWTPRVDYNTVRQSIYNEIYSSSSKYWQFCSDGQLNGIYNSNGDFKDLDLDLGYNIFI